MEKLLHERLRDWEDNGDGTVSFMALGGKAKITVSGRYDANALADEIERHYIPRPRFDDGEPVQFGDEVKGCNGGLKALLLFKDGSGQAYGSKDDPWEPICGTDFVHDDLKRPTPKVYDADGVEIKVGDTVYLANAGENNYSDDSICCKYAGEMKVVEFNKYREGYVIGETPSGKRIDSPHDWLTHEQPIFDAEGVRICKGDTVWHANHQWTVVGIVYHEGKPWVQIDNTGGEAPAQERQPFNLTHREPDSLEKLCDDMGSTNLGEFFDGGAEIAKGWHDRLTALIERGA